MSSAQSNLLLLRFTLLLCITFLMAGCFKEDQPNPEQISREALQEFFKEIKTRGIHEAYYLTHPVFQSRTPVSTLFELNAIYDFSKHEGLSLKRVHQDSKEVVSIAATLYLSNSLIVQLDSKFSEDSQSSKPHHWKMVFIEFNLKQYFEDQGMFEPSTEAQLALVRKYFFLFQRSARKRNFKDFYAECSNYWKYKFSLIEMNESYQSFINEKFLVSDFRKANFGLNHGSGFKSSGILALNGYISGPSRVDFLMEFFFESGQFRPILFSLKSS